MRTCLTLVALVVCLWALVEAKNQTIHRKSAKKFSSSSHKVRRVNVQHGGGNGGGGGRPRRTPRFTGPVELAKNDTGVLDAVDMVLDIRNANQTGELKDVVSIIRATAIPAERKLELRLRLADEESIEDGDLVVRLSCHVLSTFPVII